MLKIYCVPCASVGELVLFSDSDSNLSYCHIVRLLP